MLPESARSAYPTSLSFELSRFLISDLKVLDAFGFGDLGLEIHWENIGDPVAKGAPLPAWLTDIVAGLARDPKSYAYSHSKGALETREFLAARNNALGGARITPEDILFCNGLGDAIGKIYQYLAPEARVLVPSPTYSTHATGESGHARKPPLTFRLNPEKGWLPDIGEIRSQVESHPGIVGILVINPDNPTGMVYPESLLREIVSVAKTYGLFLVADEIYTHITYNGAKAVPLARVIGEVCGIAMKGISKEFPWPGSRCGWLEFYNAGRDPEFARLVKTLEDAKMLEVCSTTLPQLAIPPGLGDPRFAAHRESLNQAIGRRSDVVCETLKSVPGLIVNPSYGAFYNTVVFQPGALKPGQKLAVPNPEAGRLVESLVEGIPLDKRFVYYVLAATGICVVPLSSFSSDLSGFRVTLLEEDPERMRWIYLRLRAAIEEYLVSV